MHSPMARVPVRFFPCSLKTNWGVSQNGSVTTFLFLGLENALLSGPEWSEKAGDGNFHSRWISQSNLIPGSRCMQSQTATYWHAEGVACHCSIVRYNKGAVDYQWSTGPHLPLLKNTIGMKESLMWDTGYIFLSDWKKTLCLNIHNTCWWVRTGSGSLVCWDWAGQMSLHFKQLLPPPSLVLEMRDNRLAPFDWKLLEGRNYILLRFLFFLGWTSCGARTTGWQQLIKWAFTILTVTIIIKLKPNSGAHKNEPR